MNTWEAFLAEHFPGYLLPETGAQALSVEAAARFLEGISGEPRQLFLLLATSALSPRIAAIEDLALRELPRLVRGMPAQAEVVRQVTLGQLRGQLDVRATLERRLGGRPTELVARARRRQIDQRENVLVKALARRLVAVIGELCALGAVGSAGFFAKLPGCREALSRLLSTTALGAVADEPITFMHEQAAEAARHPAYGLALDLYRALREALDFADPKALARLVAEGALAPLAAPARFELAVLVRLIQALEQALARRQPGRFTLSRTLILKNRRDIAELRGDDGAKVAFFYNQACLGPGPCDLGVRHYLGQKGRLRPDITVISSARGAPPRATVIEAKLSDDPGYLAQGYQEALLYRAEYAPALTGWPKAILVTSAVLGAAPRREDEVIAVGWDQWVPQIVLEGLLEGLC